MGPIKNPEYWFDLIWIIQLLISYYHEALKLRNWRIILSLEISCIFEIKELRYQKSVYYKTRKRQYSLIQRKSLLTSTINMGTHTRFRQISQPERLINMYVVCIHQMDLFDLSQSKLKKNYFPFWKKWHEMTDLSDGWSESWPNRNKCRLIKT